MAILIAVSVGAARYVNGLTFQKAWEDQKDFFAQAYLACPTNKNRHSGDHNRSAILSVFFGRFFFYRSLNMIYAPNLHENPIPYQMILAASPQMNSMPELIQDQEINRTSRVFEFIGNTSDMVAVYMPDQGCLKVISPDTDPKSFQSGRYADLWANMIKLSILNRIETNAERGAAIQILWGSLHKHLVLLLSTSRTGPNRKISGMRWLHSLKRQKPVVLDLQSQVSGFH